MAEPKKLEAGAEAAPALLESTASGEYRLKTKELGRVKDFHVPLTNRSYNVDTITQDQLAQLQELGWPHVEQVP